MNTTMAKMGAAPDKRRSARRLLADFTPGALLCAAIAIPAYEVSHFAPSLDALTVSLIMGIILRNVLGPGAAMQPGVRMATALFIPIGIILYATRLNFQVFSSLPIYTVIGVLFCMAFFYLFILLGTRLLQIDLGTGLLIASGSAICGASAIAVLSPVVEARSRAVSIALIVTTTAGLTGALVYPIAADALGLSSTTYGIFCGSTLQQMGAVRLAASHLGDAALTIGTTVKMMRIAMLAPITVIMALAAPLQRRRRDGKGNGFNTDAAPAASGDSARRMIVRRAWFLPVFMAVALLFSFYKPAANLSDPLEPVATIAMALSLAGIGLGVDFESIKSSGSKPLLLGFAGWAAVGSVFLFILAPLLSL